MEYVKCKNSVFCVRFLIFFLIGTICGIWLFRCLAPGHAAWLSNYCFMLEHATFSSFTSATLPWFRPLALVVIIHYSSLTKYLLPVLIVFRGMLTTYSFCAIRLSGSSPGVFLFRGVLLLPLFYLLCFYADESV